MIGPIRSFIVKENHKGLPVNEILLYKHIGTQPKYIFAFLTFNICSFSSNGGGTQTFHLKAASEVERQKWVTALELAKSKAYLHYVN